MSQFATKTQSRRQSGNKGPRVAIRLAGNTTGNSTRLPQRHYRRRPQQTTRNLGAFLKAPSNVDSEGFATVKRKKPRRHRAQSPLVPKGQVNNANSFAALDRDDSPSPILNVALPKVVKVKAPMGAWGAKSAKVIVDAPMKPRVSFANDSNNLMKPTAVETREYEKGSAPTEFVEYPEEEEYLKLKRNKSAWRPKSVPQVKEECHEDVYDARVSLNRGAYEVFNQVPVPTYIGSWADACDNDSDSENEEEIVLTDSLGRPMTDNSAW